MKRLKLVITGILLIAIFITLNLTNFSKEVRNFFYLISEPIQRTFWRLGRRVSDFGEMFAEIKNLKRENEELKLKIQSLMAENLALKELKKENEILRRSLGIGLQKEFKLKMAEVIGKDISPDTLLINKGSNDGVFRNFPVITAEKVLVGKISEVYPAFSKVQLISNKNSTFDAKIAQTNIPGIVRGRGNLKLFFEFVPQAKEVKEGQIVVTTSLGGIYPKGLLAGKIEKIKKTDVLPFQEITLSPLFDINEIEFLFIITDF